MGGLMDLSNVLAQTLKLSHEVDYITKESFDICGLPSEIGEIIINIKTERKYRYDIEIVSTPEFALTLT